MKSNFKKMVNLHLLFLIAIISSDLTTKVSAQQQQQLDITHVSQWDEDWKQMDCWKCF